jgi:alkylation response protein AidB-like acyl-CoA dehydrogenase
MRFGLSEEHETMAPTVRSFVENEIYPHEHTVEKTGKVAVKIGEEIKHRCIHCGVHASNFLEEVSGGRRRKLLVQECASGRLVSRAPSGRRIPHGEK